MIKRIIDRYKQWKNKIQFMKDWRSYNSHNKTQAPVVFKPEHVRVGNYTYGTLNVIDYSYWSDVEVKLEIGSLCSIAPEVTFILGGNHVMDRFSTYPIDKFVLGNPTADNKYNGDIIIEDDVWIGYGCTLLSGVHIGKGAVIAAGTTVHSDVPAFSIFGNQGVIKYRFSEDVRSFLLNMDYSGLTEAFIRDHSELFLEPMTMDCAIKLRELLAADKERVSEIYKI